MAELRRKHGFSDAELLQVAREYGGLDVTETKRLSGLESDRRNEPVAHSQMDHSKHRPSAASGLCTAPLTPGMRRRPPLTEPWIPPIVNTIA